MQETRASTASAWNDLELYRIAEDQLGYFTTAQAAEAGVDRRVVAAMVKRATLERTSRGLYRIVNFPRNVTGQERTPRCPRAAGELVELLETGLQAGHGDFTFRRKGEPYVMPGAHVRVNVAVEYKGKPWGTVRVDVSRSEACGTEVELLSALDLQEFGLQGPDRILVPARSAITPAASTWHSDA